MTQVSNGNPYAQGLSALANGLFTSPASSFQAAQNQAKQDLLKAQTAGELQDTQFQADQRAAFTQMGADLQAAMNDPNANAALAQVMARVSGNFAGEADLFKNISGILPYLAAAGGGAPTDQSDRLAAMVGTQDFGDTSTGHGASLQNKLAEQALTNQGLMAVQGMKEGGLDRRAADTLAEQQRQFDETPIVLGSNQTGYTRDGKILQGLIKHGENDRVITSGGDVYEGAGYGKDSPSPLQFQEVKIGDNLVGGTFDPNKGVWTAQEGIVGKRHAPQQQDVRSVEQQFLDDYAAASIGELWDKQPDVEAQYNTVSTGLDLLDRVQTGPAVEETLWMRQIMAEWFGVDTTRVAETEQLQSLLGEQIMAQIQKTKGAVSDWEMRFFVAISPSLAKTTEGNRAILNEMKWSLQLSRELAQEARKRLDAGASLSETEMFVANARKEAIQRRHGNVSAEELAERFIQQYPPKDPNAPLSTVPYGSNTTSVGGEGGVSTRPTRATASAPAPAPAPAGGGALTPDMIQGATTEAELTAIVKQATSGGQQLPAELLNLIQNRQADLRSNEGVVP